MRKKISYEQYEQIWNQNITEFLKNASQEERYQLVAEWNHDSGYGVFNWIIDDSETDGAIALMMYWQSGGECNKTYSNREDMMEQSPWDSERFDLIEKLEEKYLSGFFKNQVLAYDPTCDYCGYDWTKEEWGELERDLPDEMLKKLDGIKVPFSKDWAEGVPSCIWEKMNEFTVI